MQLPPVPVEDRRIRIRWWGRLRHDDFAGVVFVDAEPVVLKVDAQRTQLVGDGAIGAPAAEDAARVGAEGDDVAEGF